MSLSIGIVGLPNVGKSTLFNALTKAQNAQAANYPFCTIEPNKATVAVPDERVDALSAKVSPKKTIHASVDFIDIAGLVRGASKGEGLGNQFLGNIRECAAIVEVVRCFEDENITHVDGSVDPLRDIDTIETELLLTPRPPQRSCRACWSTSMPVTAPAPSNCPTTRPSSSPGVNWAC